MQMICKTVLFLSAFVVLSSKTAFAGSEATAKPAAKPAVKPTVKPTVKPASKAQGASAKPASIKSTSLAAKAPPAKPPINKNQTLAKITSDHDGNISRLVAVLDDKGLVLGIRFDTKVFDTTPATTTTKSYSIKDIASDRGVVLLNSSGYDAIFLKGAVDSGSGTGKLEVRYLANALWGSYETCRASVSRDASGTWRIINAENRPVDEFFVQSHSTGITTIRGICF